MTTYYVDPAASGTNNGSSWTNAWTSLQSAADTAVAGDLVYMRGTQLISSTIDFDTNAGSLAAGKIRFIGCNASGTVDGTRFVIDAQSNAISALTWTATADHIYMENVRITGAGSYGIYFSSGDVVGCVFSNMCFDNCDMGVWGSANCIHSIFYRCVAYNNTQYGFAFYDSNIKFIFCASRDNTKSGWYGNGGTFYGCISHGNGDCGITDLYLGSTIINCVFDANAGNGDAGIAIKDTNGTYNSVLLLGNRITNHSGTGEVGIDCYSEHCVSAYNYLKDNTDHKANDGRLVVLCLDDMVTASDVEDTTLSSDGYVDQANHDFSTTYVDANDPLRRTAITIPWT